MSDASSEINKHLRTIFVFTCGVDESDICMTVKSAYENARFPSRIYFGIIDQRTDGQFSNTDSYKNVKKVNAQIAILKKSIADKKKHKELLLKNMYRLAGMKENN